jgi:hypothetical protein
MNVRVPGEVAADRKRRHDGEKPGWWEGDFLGKSGKFKLAKQIFSSYLIDEERRNPLIYGGFKVIPSQSTA